MFPAGGSGLHLVVNEHGKFLESNFQKAVGSLASSVLEAQLQDQLSEKDERKKRWVPSLACSQALTIR